MNTNIMAMGIAITVVAGLIISLGLLNLIIGSINSLLIRPKITFLKSTLGKTGFAFSFEWDEVKDPAKFDIVKIRLFNPFGHPTQVEVAKEFEGQSQAFVQDLDFGPGLETFLAARGFDDAQVLIEFVSSEDGLVHRIEMKGSEFKKRMTEAFQTVEGYLQSRGRKESEPKKVMSFGGGVPRETVANTVPGKVTVLKLATNPLFAGALGSVPSPSHGGGEGAAAKSAAPKENFNIEKVWIAPGCIVCNACEDIYPEVFQVLADTCIIRPNPPLNDGLRIQEASDACPVEVIKFTPKAAT